MPRYFFHLHDSIEGVFQDSEGKLLADEKQARLEAGRLLSEIVKDTLPQDGIWRDLAMVVKLERDGEPLFETRLHWETLFGATDPKAD